MCKIVCWSVCPLIQTNLNGDNHTWITYPMKTTIYPVADKDFTYIKDYIVNKLLKSKQFFLKWTIRKAVRWGKAGAFSSLRHSPTYLTFISNSQHMLTAHLQLNSLIWAEFLQRSVNARWTPHQRARMKGPLLSLRMRSWLDERLASVCGTCVRLPHSHVECYMIIMSWRTLGYHCRNALTW